MQRMGRAVLAAALAAAAIVGPPPAVTLLPGTYQMEWKRTSGQNPFSEGSPIELRLMSAAEAKKMPGLVSKKCLVGRDRRFRVVLDESKGTGKGYDTAYVTPAADALESGGLSRATKLPLKNRGGWVEFDGKEPPEVDLTFGEPGSQVKQKAGISLMATLYQPRTGPTMAYAFVGVLGCWSGKIKTDTGEIAVQLVDMNSNGILGDKTEVGSLGVRRMQGDQLILGDPTAFATLEDYPSIGFFGAPVAYGGKLYTIEAAKTGEKLDVRPYSGDIGKLRIEAKDSYGNPAQCGVVILDSRAATYYLKGGEETEVPAGDYDDATAAILAKQEATGKRQLAVVVRAAKLSVEKNATTTLDLGGKVSMFIEPRSKPLTVKRGQQLDVSLTFGVTDGQFGGFVGGRSVAVKVLAPNGKAVASGKAEFG